MDSDGGDLRLDRFPAPRWLVDHATAFRDSGTVPATPRLAATVILVRPAPTGFEIFAQRRAATMAFAPGMYAFPGGSVDPSDSEAFIDWAGPRPEQWASRLGLPVGTAQAVVCAAVRELFEETGVLLGGTGDGRELDEVTGAEWERARADLVARRRSLTGWFAETGLSLRADLLVPWTRWLTPEFEPRRFDTFFFLALLPPSQHPRDVGGEADHSIWIAPAGALDLPMLPPTRHTLQELASFATIDALLDAAPGRRLAEPVTPTLVLDGDTAYFRL